MPTIIALDVSLSMQRTIPGRSEDNALTYHQLAAKGITHLLEHLSNISKLEYVALVTYSTQCEIKVDFTRDYDQVRQAVKKVESGDKLCLISMLKSVAGILATNWGTQNGHCQVVAFTDCGLGFGSTALKGFLQNCVGKEKDSEYTWMQVLKPVKLNFVCMGLHSDYYFIRALKQYQQLLNFNRLKGQLFRAKVPAKDAADGAEASDQLKSNSGGAATNPAANSSSANTTTGTSSSNSSGGGGGGGPNNPTAGGAVANGAPPPHSSHKSELGRTTMCEMIERLCESSFKPYETVLRCGGYFRLECPIIVWPPPTPYHADNGAQLYPQTLAPKLEICGFLQLSDIGSPATLSRHLIIPKVERERAPSRRSSEKQGSAAKNGSGGSGVGVAAKALDPSQPNYEFEKLEQEIREFYTRDVREAETEVIDDGSTEGSNTKAAATSSGPPELQKESVCVLLHGALKVESLAALVLLNDNWYGFIHSYADSKKKSNLMLNILPPGTNIIPWLGDLSLLGFPEDLMPGETCAFPVKAEKRSYSQNCVVWIRHASLGADIQKVLRHAKKMPEKTQQFFKELNRIRRAALSLGFLELIEIMADLFDAECSQFTLNSNPDCLIQLKHAAIELRKPSNLDLKVAIAPIVPFTNGGGVGASIEGGGAGAPPPSVVVTNPAALPPPPVSVLTASGGPSAIGLIPTPAVPSTGPPPGVVVVVAPSIIPPSVALPPGSTVPPNVTAAPPPAAGTASVIAGGPGVSTVPVNVGITTSAPPGVPTTNGFLY